MNDELTIKTLVTEAFDNSEAHGFHDPPCSFGDLIALIHSEASEALEEYREGHQPRDERTRDDGKPEGVPSELADIVIRVADMCGIYGIDLEGAIRRKMAHNRTRPFKHGGKLL